MRLDMKGYRSETSDNREPRQTCGRPIYEAVKDWDEPVAIAVLPDHPTPCELRTHTSEPIPFLIWYPGIEPDEVQTYDEVSACNGSYGVLKEDEFIKEFMK